MPSPKGYTRLQIALHWGAALLIVQQYLFKDAIAAAWDATTKGLETTFNPLVLAHVAGGALGARHGRRQCDAARLGKGRACRALRADDPDAAQRVDGLVRRRRSGCARAQRAEDRAAGTGCAAFCGLAVSPLCAERWPDQPHAPGRGLSDAQNLDPWRGCTGWAGGGGLVSDRTAPDCDGCRG